MQMEISKKKYGMGSNVWFMIAAARNVPSVLYFVVVQALIAVGISLLELFVTPVMLGKIEAHAALGELLVLIGCFTFGLMLLRMLAAYIELNTLPGRVEVRTGIINKIVRKSAVCSYPFVENSECQNRLAKAREVVQSNDAAAEAIWKTLYEILKNCIAFVIYLILLRNINLFLIMITLVTTIAGYLVTNYISGWEYRHREEKAAILRKLYYVQEKSQDRYLAKDVRIFGMENWLKELLDGHLKLFEDFCKRREKKYLLADAIDVMLAFLRNGIAYGYLITLTLKGELSVARFLLFFTAVGGFTEWVRGILSGFSTLHKQCLDISPIREYLDQEEIFRMEGGERLDIREGLPFEIELRNVTFRYPGADKPVLKKLNLTIPWGEKLAVVGRNGVGKTTLVKLICGLYDPTEGEVLLNGVNVKKFNRREYYRLFAGVFQDFSILAGSVLLNVSQEMDGDRKRAWDCLEKAGAADKIRSLPQGLDTHMDKSVFNDATEFSGGEMQRLMLARLLYRNSPVILLDEPTAALDAIAESDIYNRYQELTAGHTSVYISHRLASTRFCDRIILLENGGIAEEGTHEKLLAEGGRYAELFKLQSKYYQEGGEGNEQDMEEN